VNALDGGHLVGRYRILSFLGAGAMGEVYLAEDPQIDRRLAIKTVRLVGRPQEIEDRKKRLLREARAAGRLLHPNVVTLFDAGEAEGMLYLAFEYVEGTDLAHRLDKGARMSLREALRAVRQAAEALDYAHRQGIVHRDIKPSNLLLDLAGWVKVADFGIAKMAGQSTELTMAGSVMGSPQYLSPEQIRGEDLDGRSDIFSLGVVFYEILSGKRPFEGDTITTLVYQILHKEPPPVSALRAVPPRVETLLRGMLAKGHDERIASAGAVASELALIEAELSDETLSAPAGTGPMDVTHLLPRRATNAEAVAASGSGAAPAVPSALGTVPASPPTTPSVPPPVPTVAASLPTASAALNVPAPPPPSYAAAPAMPAPPPQKRFPVALVIAALLLVAIVGVAGAGYYAWRFWKSHFAAAGEQTAQAQTSTPPTASTSQEPAGAVATSAEASPPPAAPIAATPPSSAVPSPVPSSKVPPASASQPAAIGRPDGAASERSPPPAAPEPPSRSRVPAAGQTVPPVPVPSSPRETSPARPEPAAPAAEEADEPKADQTLRSTMEVSFHVTPPDAHVLVEGRVIGEAQDWSGQKGARTYTFPSVGTYLVKIRKPGMKELRIAVEAGAGGLSTINAHLAPIAAAEVDATDLQTLRVREGVSFDVRPAVTEVEVDGQPMGAARRFAGGFLRPKEILLLPAGKHRISLVLRGYRRKDFLVEVSETADKARDRIEWVLTPGGNE
jgi:serine/threonine protein kinase